MDTTLILAGVIVAAAGVGATIIIWVLRGVFNLGGLHAKVDALAERVEDLGELHVKVGVLTERVGVLTERVDVLTERVDVLTERVEDLSKKVDTLAEGQRALQADLHRVINMMTGLANHRHDVDGNTVFNVPPNP